MKYDLLAEPWLSARPAEDAESTRETTGPGSAEGVGVRRLLLEAHRFQDLVVDVPTQKPAIYRQVLLPIIVDALGQPEDPDAWMALFQAGAFCDEQRAKLTAYLDEHAHLFDLFDPVHPFAQVAGLRTAKDETKGSALLVATAATGNNVPLFSSRTEADRLELTPAEAARWLLHTHCWDTAAIKTGAVGDRQVKAGKTTGNPTGPLGQLGVVMPIGRTVFETLLLNIPYGGTLLSDNLPQWRRRGTDGSVEDALVCSTPAWRARASRGLLDVWTWQSRRIRLFPEDTPAGPRVTRVVVAAGDRLTTTPDHEPHTAWDSPSSRKKSNRGGTSAIQTRPRRHQSGRAAWRGLEALLAVHRVGQAREVTGTRSGFQTSELLGQLSVVRDRMSEAYPLQLELTGIFYGNQSAVIEDMFFDAIPLPLAALDSDGIVYGHLLTAVDQAEKLAYAINNLSANLRRAAGADPIPWDKGQRPGDTLLHALDPVVRRLLVGLRTIGEDDDLAEQGMAAWEHKAGIETWKVAEQIFSTAPPGLFLGRKVTKDGKEEVYRIGTAERAFRHFVNTILTRRAHQRTAA